MTGCTSPALPSVGSNIFNRRTATPVEFREIGAVSDLRAAR
jgi:hypothetical protein